jgi:hypothetical protein
MPITPVLPPSKMPERCVRYYQINWDEVIFLRVWVGMGLHAVAFVQLQPRGACTHSVKAANRDTVVALLLVVFAFYVDRRVGGKTDFTKIGLMRETVFWMVGERKGR